MVSCTAFVLSHRTGTRPGHQLDVVAYRDGQLYYICIGTEERSKGEEAEDEEGGRDREKSYNLHTDSKKNASRTSFEKVNYVYCPLCFA